ncbi:rRNA methyltransferase [Bifidobacterium ramosum]|uniref:rRNA methyltransferase n=2 Tax=Bifidobacterium ramosum TaxID=1798158 RepID=A0A6L4X2Q1_9BIFI|nr:rRNA methyltransferase [Bifidobacterium ramosum]
MVTGMPISAEVLANVKADRIRRVSDLANRRSREKSGRFLIEGPQSVREVVAWHPDVVRDLYVQAGDASDGSHDGFANQTIAAIAQAALDSDIYVHRATREVMTRISSDAQGIAAVGDLTAMRDAMRFDGVSSHGASANDSPVRDASSHDTSVEDAAERDAHDGGADDGSVRGISGPFVAAFWQVRDPGNAGTVIRAADAAGCDAVVFVDDCVDVFNPKVIRSTAGSLFHLPVVSMTTGGFFDRARADGVRVIAADVYGTDDRKPELLPDVLAERSGTRRITDDPHGDAILFGNEARGLPRDVLKRCDRIVSIPLYGKAESLNLGTSAAVMLMSLAMARR